MQKINITFQSPGEIARQIIGSKIKDKQVKRFFNWILMFLFYSVFGITGIHRLFAGIFIPALFSTGSLLGGLYLIIFTDSSFIGFLLLGLALIFYILDLFRFLGNDISYSFIDTWLPLYFVYQFFFFTMWLCWIEFLIAHYRSIPYLNHFVDNYLIDLINKYIPFL